MLRKHTWAQQGQALIETLIALPFFLLFTLAILQIGLLIYLQAVVDHAGFMIGRSATMKYVTAEDMLIQYRKLSSAFKSAPVQITASVDHPTQGIPALKIQITQAYQSSLLTTGKALAKIMDLEGHANQSPAPVDKRAIDAEPSLSDQFNQMLAKRGYITLHTEVHLPLPYELRDRYSSFIQTDFPGH